MQTSFFSSPMGLLKFSKLSIYSEVVLLDTFLNYVSTRNFQEVMKFYLDHKSVEIDFYPPGVTISEPTACFT